MKFDKEFIQERLRMLYCLAVVAVLIALVVAPAAFAAVDVGASTSFGAGQQSTGDRIRHATGFTVHADQAFTTAARTTIGPRLEMTNLVNSSSFGTTSVNALYDHRLIGVGVVASRYQGNLSFDESAAWFGAATGGMAWTKMTLDESSPASFRESSFTGIQGTYVSGIFGYRQPLRPRVSLLFGIQGTMINLNQDVAGKGEREDVVDGAFLTAPTERKISEGLPKHLIQKNLAAKLGFNFSF